MHNIAPSNIFDNGRNLTEPREIANFFNKYFVKVAADIQSSKKIVFKNWFTLSSDFYTYNTHWSNLSCIVVPPLNTKLYGRNSVNISAVYSWNYLDKINENNLFYQLLPNTLKIIIKNLFLNSCN